MKRTVPSIGILSLAVVCFFALALSQSDLKDNTSSVVTTKKDPRDCDCFTVSGTDPGYFQHYKLWDFRDVPLKQADTDSPETDKHNEGEWEDWYEDDDKNYDKDEDAGKQDSYNGSLYFFKTAFDKDWISQRWHRPRSPKAPVTMINSKQNVFFTRDSEDDDPEATYLVLRTIRNINFTSTAEIETRVKNIFHCSLRLRLRILPASMHIAQPPQSRQQPLTDLNQPPIPVLNTRLNIDNTTSPVSQDTRKPPSGACVGVFTYHAKNCESDIEILTSDPTHRVRYANQPDYDPITDRMIPGAATVVDVPTPWTTWSTHRLDWYDDQSRWYVNDKLEEVKSYRVPNLQSRLVINLWSDGGFWTGDMKIGDKVFLGIEYIELAYNRSSDGNYWSKIPPESNHGGHQRLYENTSAVVVEESEEELFGPETEILTGATVKKKKCKKGKKGDKCRKKKKKKHGGKGGKPTGPRCRRVCNIDELRFTSKN
ncbi:uncharacterized protein N7484_009659 [Penicillium longicatenatum]|uniref:uncharacterized protein n=1 Tax=Penicillium longicatenatum TaxID=1561947 RepID=UPI002548D23E|nr:uncharacterized protein N7484_009659 [Penicillium longicatenatum]KAJ5636346.1 hypothetical protein N7484_009659 [Penicillium longicatenatum]